MLKQKFRIHHIPIALAVFVVVTASSFFALNIFAQTITNTTTDTTTATSTNTNTTPPTCSFNYSDWTSCSSSGTQTRSITSATPSGCIGGSPETSRNCTYNPPTSTTPNYSVPCNYDCTNWEPCQPNGKQNCLKIIKTSSGCAETTMPSISRSCTYTAPLTNTTNAVANCTAMCASWSNCGTDGYQIRTCSMPAGCSGTINTEKQRCVAENSIGDSTTATVSNTNSTTNSNQNTAVNTATTAANSVAPVDPDNSINQEWKKNNFKTENCPDQTCGGTVDPDKDGLSNNDEFRYGTDPKNRDTDNDGKIDGEEIASGTDPLRSSAEGETDTITFESPKEEGTVKADIYSVTNVEMVAATEGGEKYMRVTGRGPALSYITIYIYSGDPIIVTVKTDSNGDWTYNVDRKLDDGNHEVYVAVTNNSGSIKAKSEPLPFVKTAQAVQVAEASENNVVAPASKSGISITKVLYILAAGFVAVVLAFILLGWVIKKLASKINLN